MSSYRRFTFSRFGLALLAVTLLGGASLPRQDGAISAVVVGAADLGCEEIAYTSEPGRAARGMTSLLCRQPDGQWWVMTSAERAVGPAESSDASRIALNR
jgi:hypothetical protein